MGSTPSLDSSPKHNKKLYMGPVPSITKSYTWDWSQVKEKTTYGTVPKQRKKPPMGPVPSKRKKTYGTGPKLK
jgi:hypothetical protein